MITGHAQGFGGGACGLGPIRVWVWSAVLWGGVAVLAATQQWAEIQGTGKALSWWRALAWQGSSWWLLIPATPMLLSVVRRWPIDRVHAARAAWHAGASLAFAALFLGCSVPLRLAWHPSPARWSFFGEAFYKSIPQGVAIGLAVYWGVVAIASLIETRARLHAVIEHPEPEPGPRHAPRSATERPLVLHTPAGVTRLLPRELAWVEPAPGGSRLHTDAGDVLVRHTLAELESILGKGFVRCHRAAIVNAARVRELRGSPSRDGTIRLDTGQSLPVARRRHASVTSAIGPGAGPQAARD